MQRTAVQDNAAIVQRRLLLLHTRRPHDDSQDSRGRKSSVQFVQVLLRTGKIRALMRCLWQQKCAMRVDIQDLVRIPYHSGGRRTALTGFFILQKGS